MKPRRVPAHPSPADDRPPGSNIRRLREALEISQRALAEACRPPLDHTTIRRVELNHGYTSDTLERVANALSRRLGRPVTVSDLFLPTDLASWTGLPDDVQKRLSQQIRDAADAVRYRRRNPE